MRLSAPLALAVCLAIPPAARAGDPAAPTADPQPDAPPKAQDAAERPATPRYEERIEVEARGGVVSTQATAASKVPSLLLHTPASVSVVPRALLDAQDTFFLGDALRNVGGVNVATGFGVFDYFVVRGFDSLTSGLVLTDGAPEPESSFYPTYNLAQVEVLKGPAAFLYGGSPLAGAVQLVRKQPLPSRFADVSLSYGRFDTLETALDGNLGRADGPVSARLNATHRRSDGHRDDKRSELTALNPAVTYRPDPRTRLALNVEYVRSEFQPDVGIPLLGDAVADVPRTRSYQSPFDRSEQDLYRLRLDVERRLGDRLTLRDKLYYTDLDWVSDGTLFVGVFPGRPGPDLYRTLTLLDDRQRLLGNQLEAVLRFSTGGWSHSFLAGLEASRLRDDFDLDVAPLPPIGLSQAVETATPPVVPIPGLTQQGRTKSRTLAAYLVDRVAVSRRLHLVLGARLDRIDFEDAATGTERDATRVSPAAGLVFAPTPELSVYVSAGGAFAPPSSLVVGEREPEDSRQLEVGVKRALAGGRGSVTAAAFQLERRNIAIPDSGGVLRQQGDQRSRGVELELSAEPARGWTATLAYAFTDAELTRFTEIVPLGPMLPAFQVLDRSGNAPAFAPRHILNAWVARRLGERFSLGAGLRALGRQFIGSDEGFAIPAYGVLDAAAAYRDGRYRVALNARNLTGTESFTRGFAQASVLPAEPFSLSATVEIGFGRR